MATSSVIMAKIKPELKAQLKEVSQVTGYTMSELVMEQFRLLLKNNNLPTI